jgi:hypothetical protein
MDDQAIHQRINSLSREEESLYLSASHDGGLSPADRARLRAIRVELDQYWDLLHQREARRAAGLDPDEAHLRAIGTVESYQQ